MGVGGFASLVFVTATWYGQPFLLRQFLRHRLTRSKHIEKPVTQTDHPQQLSELSELLDATARNLRLGKSMASSLVGAVESCASSQDLISELVKSTSRGESVSETTKKLTPKATTNGLAFVLRTIDIATTGGVGGVLALERGAIVLRERISNIDNRQMQAAQAMLSARVLSWSPVFMASWLILSSATVRNFLLLSLAGWLCILLGLGFNFAGRRWMQLIIGEPAK